MPKTAADLEAEYLAARNIPVRGDRVSAEINDTIKATQRELDELLAKGADDLLASEARRANALGQELAKLRLIEHNAQPAKARTIDPYLDESTADQGGFGSALARTDFDVKARPSVSVSPSFLIKNASTLPSITEVSPRTPSLVPMGRDSRWLYPLLQREDIGDDLSIQDFKQTARTLTGTVERSPVATTDKATLDVTISLVNEAVKEEAVVIPGIPLALVQSMEGLREFLNQEGTFQVEKALDEHVFAQIAAAAPPFGTSGADLIAKIRNGVASMRAEGANPNIVVVNATDAASLDLSADAGGYVFPTRDSGSSSPLWGLRVVERTSAAGNEPPYLIDSNMLGKLYIGNLRFDADPYAGAGGANFKKNLVDLRVEVKALFHVRNAKGARRIAAA